ncbi:type II toxin-antitoxin system HigA family antitoxin [Thiomicrorhabdus sp. Milos-T2]|uniref:helix-turn-helix domain-containing protein n=1 Tax=Thiomicrorhabdus sp. Milos-T2 TaxID=90814 RepID=UPI000494D070|nr:transcriptional regulator [Thiomicrorhabdus sp. Milos-T2]
MHIKPIRTNQDHQNALNRIDALFDAEHNTPEGDELEVLVELIHAYEEVHFPIETPDPIEAIKFRMEQQGMTDADLVPYLGQRSRVSEVLNRKRRLSLQMIRKLHSGLNIPIEALITEYRLTV